MGHEYQFGTSRNISINLVIACLLYVFITSRLYQVLDPGSTRSLLSAAMSTSYQINYGCACSILAVLGYEDTYDYTNLVQILFMSTRTAIPTCIFIFLCH